MKASVVGLVAIVASVVLSACSGQLPCCGGYYVACPPDTRVCSSAIPAPAPVAPGAQSAAILASAKLESRRSVRRYP